MMSIEVLGVRKSFHTGPVLKDLDLAIPEGSIYGLMGRNGAGKSTLLRMLIGLVHPDAGAANVLGRRLSQGCPKEKELVAYVAQGEILPGWARIADLRAFEEALRPSWTSESLDTWLKAEKLTNDRNVGALSAGQRKRLELELALAARPKVLLMDEPFAGLDPVSRTEFIASVMAYAASEQLTILLSSHILNDLERLCDRVGVLADGKLAYETEMDVLSLRSESEKVRSNRLHREARLSRAATPQSSATEIAPERAWLIFLGFGWLSMMLGGLEASRSGMSDQKRPPRGRLDGATLASLVALVGAVLLTVAMVLGPLRMLPVWLAGNVWTVLASVSIVVLARMALVAKQWRDSDFLS